MIKERKKNNRRRKMLATNSWRKIICAMQVLILWMDAPSFLGFLFYLSLYLWDPFTAPLHLTVSLCFYIFLSILSALPHPN